MVLHERQAKVVRTREERFFAPPLFLCLCRKSAQKMLFILEPIEGVFAKAIES